MDFPLQESVITRLHYALKPGGLLMLGPVEKILGRSALFGCENVKHSIYVKTPAAKPPARAVT